MNKSVFVGAILGAVAVTAGSEMMGADTLIGNEVCNLKGEDLGTITEIMLDMRTGRVVYAVLSFNPFFSMGEKLFAVPWKALTLDTENKRFTLNVANKATALKTGALSVLNQ